MGVLVFSIFRTRNTVQRCTTARERALVIRATAACWLLGFMLVVALIFLPNKGRVMLALPAFFLTVSIARAYHNSRQRLQREQSQRIDLEKMKRAN